MKTHFSDSLDKDYAYCEKVIKKHSKSFYYAFSQLPKEKAQAIYAIYAFCRQADDSVDLAETPEEQLAALDQLENELALFEQGQPVDSPLWRALTDVFERYDMSCEPFYAQLTGQRMDISFTVPQTLEDLEDYSYYVAGSVGLTLLPVLATQTKKDLTQTAIQLGVAMQLTNILRDVGEDFQEINRVYLPEQELENVDYTLQQLEQQTINQEFIRMWEKIAQRAETLYDAVEENFCSFDEDSRLPVQLSSRIYRGILDAVRENNYDCFTKRNFVSAKNMKRIYQSIQ